MKEQVDIKQDFDRWLFDQWKEETYVPSSQDRNIFSKKLGKRRARKIWTIGLSVALFSLLILSGVFIRSSSHPETTKNQQPKDVSISMPTMDVSVTEIPAQQRESNFLPVNFYGNNHLLPFVYEPFENIGSIEIPADERIFIVQDLAPMKRKNHVNLDTVMMNLGIFFLQTSTSNDGKEFVGVSSGHELVTAHLMEGSSSLPISPDTFSMDGGFRPIGMSENQYVEYSFYDVRQLLFNEAVYRKVLAVNVLPRIAYYMRTAAPGWNNPVGVQMRQEVPQPISNATRNQDENMRRIARQAEPGNPYSPYKPGRPFYLRQPIRVNNMAKVGLLIADNFLIKSQGGKVLVVSCDAERVSVVKEDGVIEASHSITIQHPRYFSQKAKYPFYDEVSGRLYLIVETNFSYMWYEVDQLTGKTRFIFKTETIWNNPNWSISNAVLTYVFKGKMYRQALN
jgi:hypothetical protein